MDAPTEALAGYAASLTYDELTPEAIHGAKRCLVDAIACALGGSSGEPIAMARHLARSAIGVPPSRVLVSGEPTTPEMAAFANAFMIRYLDANDAYQSKDGGHPSDSLAAVLAIADATGATGRETILGVVIAYEISCALIEAESVTLGGFDQTLHGTISSGLAAGKMLGLDAGRMAQALSLALVSSVPLRVMREGTLTMWKSGSSAAVTRNGVFGARLAALGMTGPADPFLAPGGLAAKIGSAPELPRFGGRGGEFHTTRTNMKPFAAEYHSQAAIWAALEIREAIAGEPVAEVTIYTYEHAYRRTGSDPAKFDVRDRETADHSMPYVVAAALLDGVVGPAQFTQVRIDDPAIRELIAHTSVREDPALTAGYPGRLGAKVEVRMDDGRTLSAAQGDPKGHARNPMSDDELAHKFREYADGVLPSAQVEAALDRLWSLDDEPDVRALIDGLISP